MKVAFLVASLLALSLPGLSVPLAHAGESRPDTALAPAFRLPGRNAIVNSDSLRGKFIYADFWASWCVPCRNSFPWLAQLHEKYASKGLAIVAINLDKNRSAAYKFLEQFPAPFLVAFDEKGETAEAFDVSAMPTSVLIDPSGRILWTHAGFDPDKANALETEIKEVLER